MGGVFRFTLVLVLIFQMLVPNSAVARPDLVRDLAPIMPIIRDDGSPGDIFPPIIRQPRRTIIRPDTSIRGYSIDTVTMDIAAVPEEFACPLFEDKSYESIIFSLEKLNEAVKSSVKCPTSPNMQNIVETTEKIRDAVKNLKPHFDKPETAYQNLPAIEENITKAVSGVNSIAEALSNPVFTKSECGASVVEHTDIFTSLSTLITNLGPYALLAISMAPALSSVVKVGAIALIAGSSSVAEFQKISFSRNLDMTNHEQWKAVLLNTCSYSRVDRKIKYIKRFADDVIPVAPAVNPLKLSIDVLPDEIKNATKAFEKKYLNRQDRLGHNILVNKSDKKRFGEVESILEKSKVQLAYWQSQIGDAKKNPLVACALGRSVANKASTDQSNMVFPNNLVASIEFLKDYGIEESRYIGLTSTYDLLISSLASIQKTPPTNSKETTDCAVKMMSLMDILGRIVETYDGISKEIAQSREGELMTDPDYRKWKEEFEKIEGQKKMGFQLYATVRSIENSPATLKSFLDMRQDVLKQALFGNTGILGGQPPVYMWLNFTLGLHLIQMKNFEKTVGYIITDLYHLAARKEALAKSSGPGTKKVMNAVSESQNFDNLDIKNFDLKDPASAREHQLVCQRLLNAWDVWTVAVNHLDSVGLFCQMIDPMIDVSTSPSIIKFCRGSDDDILSRNSSPSRISIAVKEMMAPKYTYGNRGTEQMAMLIHAKLKTMKCNIPLASQF